MGGHRDDMTQDPLPGRVRAKVICVFRQGNRILVVDAYDPARQHRFYVPVGGGIEFGERSEVALRREIREEIGTGIENPRLLGVLENVFTFDGKGGHEIVFVYDATLADRSLYALSDVAVVESNGEIMNAIWLDLDSLESDAPPLYPHGLLGLLANG